MEERGRLRRMRECDKERGERERDNGVAEWLGERGRVIEIEKVRDWGRERH